MQILTVSSKYNTHAIFNGYGKQAYIFHSQFYGFLGYADIMEQCGAHNIKVDLFIPYSACYYSSVDYIKMLKCFITKQERQFIHKTINYGVHFLDFVTEDGKPTGERNIFDQLQTIKLDWRAGVRIVK